MTRLTTSLLVAGLLACIGTASAQSRDDGRYYGDGDPQPVVDRYDDGYGDRSGQYDYARVVRVDPVIESGSRYPASRQRCYTRDDGYVDNGGYDRDGDGYRDDGYRDDGYRDDGDRNDGYRSGSTQTGRNVATVIGGILGAAIGSQVGGGSARYATAAVGSMVGGMAGRQVYDSNRRYRQAPRTGSVTVCDPQSADAGDYRDYRDDAQVSAYDVTYEYAGRQYSTRTSYNPGDRIRVRVDVRPE